MKTQWLRCSHTPHHAPSFRSLQSPWNPSPKHNIYSYSPEWSNQCSSQQQQWLRTHRWGQLDRCSLWCLPIPPYSQRHLMLCQLTLNHWDQMTQCQWWRRLTYSIEISSIQSRPWRMKWQLHECWNAWMKEWCEPLSFSSLAILLNIDPPILQKGMCQPADIWWHPRWNMQSPCSIISQTNSNYLFRSKLLYFCFVPGTMEMLAHLKTWLNGQGPVLGQFATALTRLWVHFSSTTINL